MSSPTLIGIVEDVRGSTVGIALDSGPGSGLAFIEGHGYRVGQVGSFVRIPIGYVDQFAVVTQVGVGAVASDESVPQCRRWATAELVGEAPRDGTFQRGVAQSPTVGDSVHLVTRRDLDRIYAVAESPSTISFGALASAESIPALVDINRLITRHSAVVGSTGAGKSTAVAAILRSMTESERFPSARVMILDIHGEYSAALGDRATVFRVDASEREGERRLYVPYWALAFDELMSVTLGSLDDASLAAVMDRIQTTKAASLERIPRDGIGKLSVTVDTPIPFSIHQFWWDLYGETRSTHIERPGQPQSQESWALEVDAQGNPILGDPLKVIPPSFKGLKDERGDEEKIRLSKSTLNVTRPLERLAGRLRDPRYDFMFRPGPWLPQPDGSVDADLDTWLQALVGNDRPIVILDLSGIPSGILTNLVGALLRIVYDALFWARQLGEGGREKPLLIVLEEAHLYLSSQSLSPAVVAASRIVKEGRKYGVGAMVISQRPSEIDQTILSQCGTLFALRLSNDRDRQHVLSAASDAVAGILSALPALRTGEVIAIGEAISLPVRVMVRLPAEGARPQSEDPLVVGGSLPGGWDRTREPERYGDVIEAWRAQNPRVTLARPAQAKGED